MHGQSQDDSTFTFFQKPDFLGSETKQLVQGSRRVWQRIESKPLLRQGSDATSTPIGQASKTASQGAHLRQLGINGAWPELA